VNIATVLIVDDNPSHLKLYSWIVEQRGWKAITALVGSTKVNLPEAAAVDVILQDYRLSSTLTAVDVAKLLKQEYPLAPIVVLSEMPWMPDDMRGHAAAFVHKGEPQRLLDTLDAIMHGRLPAMESAISEPPEDQSQ
jgi:DNA-binding NtrC family response regulator